MTNEIDYVHDWLMSIGDITIPPFCVELVLSDNSRYFLHSVNSKNEDNQSVVLRIWDLRALTSNDVDELKLKINSINSRDELDNELEIHSKLDWGNLRIILHDIKFCIEWHDRFWPEELRPKIGFHK